MNSGGADRAGALDDWVRIEHKADGTNTYWLRVNQGGGTFADHVTFDVDMNCDAGPTYWFADFNNDGLDDFFCLGGGSRVSVSLNRGGNPPKFEHIGQVRANDCLKRIMLTGSRWSPNMMVTRPPTSALQISSKNFPLLALQHTNPGNSVVAMVGLTTVSLGITVISCECHILSIVYDSG